MIRSVDNSFILRLLFNSKQTIFFLPFAAAFNPFQWHVFTLNDDKRNSKCISLCFTPLFLFIVIIYGRDVKLFRSLQRRFQIHRNAYDIAHRK